MKPHLSCLLVWLICITLHLEKQSFPEDTRLDGVGGNVRISAVEILLCFRFFLFLCVKGLDR